MHGSVGRDSGEVHGGREAHVLSSLNMSRLRHVGANRARTKIFGRVHNQHVCNSCILSQQGLLQIRQLITYRGC
jgi:hypothetical protein